MSKSKLLVVLIGAIALAGCATPPPWYQVEQIASTGDYKGAMALFEQSKEQSKIYCIEHLGAGDCFVDVARRMAYFYESKLAQPHKALEVYGWAVQEYQWNPQLDWPRKQEVWMDMANVYKRLGKGYEAQELRAVRNAYSLEPTNLRRSAMYSESPGHAVEKSPWHAYDRYRALLIKQTPAPQEELLRIEAFERHIAPRMPYTSFSGNVPLSNVLDEETCPNRGDYWITYYLCPGTETLRRLREVKAEAAALGLTGYESYFEWMETKAQGMISLAQQGLKEEASSKFIDNLGGALLGGVIARRTGDLNLATNVASLVSGQGADVVRSPLQTAMGGVGAVSGAGSKKELALFAVSALLGSDPIGSAQIPDSTSGYGQKLTRRDLAVQALTGLLGGGTLGLSSERSACGAVDQTLTRKVNALSDELPANPSIGNTCNMVARLSRELRASLAAAQSCDSSGAAAARLRAKIVDFEPVALALCRAAGG